MRQVCYICKKQYGVKLPLDNDDETSGLCPICYPRELEKFRKIIEGEVKEPEKSTS